MSSPAYQGASRNFLLPLCLNQVQQAKSCWGCHTTGRGSMQGSHGRKFEEMCVCKLPIAAGWRACKCEAGCLCICEAATSSAAQNQALDSLEDFALHRLWVHMGHVRNRGDERASDTDAAHLWKAMCQALKWPGAHLAPAEPIVSPHMMQ